MQLMTWTLARLGSRFSFTFEPYRRRVWHSALGPFHDEPLDLMVGLVEPQDDGQTEVLRVLPFTQDGQLLSHCEQFERINSITYRGFCESLGVQLELNIHSTFYPQDNRLCLCPVFYWEVRVNPAPLGRWSVAPHSLPETVRVFLRIRRPQTDISICPSQGDRSPACIELDYQTPVQPRRLAEHVPSENTNDEMVAVQERIVSLQGDCNLTVDGDGLVCELPVTEEGSGTKWRMVWGSYVNEPVLETPVDGQLRPARLMYCHEWDDLDAVMEEAVTERDERLAHSRRYEKLLEQTTIPTAQRHLVHQSFQSFLANTWWCQTLEADGSVPTVAEEEAGEHIAPVQEWFSVTDGNQGYHSPIDVEYNNSLIYLSLWPKLLRLQLEQWTAATVNHKASGGAYLAHDLGFTPRLNGQAYDHSMPVECNCCYLLMLQAYARWHGERELIRQQAPLIHRLGRYLLWTDRDASGYPSEGVSNTVADAGPAMQLSNRQTYLGIKRAVALRAIGDLFALIDEMQEAERYDSQAQEALDKIEASAWLGDHYAVSTDESAAGLVDPSTHRPLPIDEVPGREAYSTYTSNGLLLPTLVGQPMVLEEQRIQQDIINAMRETLSRYGCGHNSQEPQRLRISQNLWRDVTAQYLRIPISDLSSNYWDLQVVSNTHEQSQGYTDSYINDTLYFMSRGGASFGLLLAGPRLIVDRLAAGGVYITVDPDRRPHSRWPLLPLADWAVGRVPVCMVDDEGKVRIEAKIDPVVIQGQVPDPEDDTAMIG